MSDEENMEDEDIKDKDNNFLDNFLKEQKEPRFLKNTFKEYLKNNNIIIKSKTEVKKAFKEFNKKNIGG